MAIRASAERVERQEDLEALKTHLPSNQNSLKAREETRSVASLPCSAFINGKLLGWRSASYPVRHARSLLLQSNRIGAQVRRACCAATGATTAATCAPRRCSCHVAAPVRPYTRKFEDSIMSTIDEVTILPVPGAYNASVGGGSLRRQCNVRHPHGVLYVRLAGVKRKGREKKGKGGMR